MADRPARVLVVEDDEAIRESCAVSWFAQQAVEKGMKALYLERRGVPPSRIHDLQPLAADMSVPAALTLDIAIVNPAFNRTRYPNPSHGLAPVDLIPEERAPRHLEAARRIFQWLSGEL